MPITIARLAPADHARWRRLAEAYNTFYGVERPDAEYEFAWRRLLAGDDLHAFGAYADGVLVGITHYLFHASTWHPSVCYLQDLFVDPAARGQGAARALIAAVADAARAKGAGRLYWHTQTDNVLARALYDKVARYRGFIRYEDPLG